MSEFSGLWDATDVGDGAVSGYTETQVAQFLRALISHTANLGGVCADYLNELAVSGSSSPVAVATGAAMAYGFFYYNTASVNVAISTPAVSTRVDYIVLRVDWSAQTVRITRIAGVEGAGAPSLTQTPGTTWDIPLATVSITTGGVITVTDAREWITIVGDGDVSTAKLAADAVTGAKIADDSIDSEHYVDGSIDNAHLANDAVNGSKIADDSIDSEHYVDGSIDTAHIAADAIDSTLIADGAVDPRAHIAGTNGIVVDTANGNARGNDAVDLQTTRSAGTQVASGANAVVAGGENNTASAVHSVVPGGKGAVANHPGEWAFAGVQGSGGARQIMTFVLSCTTTDANQKEMFLDGNGGSQRMTIPTDTTWVYSGYAVARRTDADNESSINHFYGCIDNNAGVVAFVGSQFLEEVAADDNVWSLVIDDDDTNDALVLLATGATAKTVSWVARVDVVQVTG